MTINTLKQGHQLHIQIQNLTDQLQRIKDYIQTHTTVTTNIAGVEVDIPKVQISAKIQVRIQDLQDQIAMYQTQFDNL